MNINGLTGNKSYIAEAIDIQSVSIISVSDNSGLFINTEEFTVNGELEIQPGSMFCVNNNSSCD